MDKLTHVVVEKSFNYEGESVPPGVVFAVGKGEDLSLSEATALIRRNRLREATEEDIAEASEAEQERLQALAAEATKKAEAANKTKTTAKK
jgi:hypothetical protein